MPTSGGARGSPTRRASATPQKIIWRACRCSCPRARLVDDPVLRQQLAWLERRAHATGRESVSHARAQSTHDDVAAAACGALVAAEKGSAYNLDALAS